jgi:hypothetical protein
MKRKSVDKIAAKDQMISGDEETDEGYTTESERVTHQDAKKCLEGLRLHFMQESNEGSPICTRNPSYICSVAVSQGEMAEYLSVISRSLTAKKHMRIEHIDESDLLL